MQQHSGVPAGLDGNPEPLTSDARKALLEEIATVIIERRSTQRTLLVAVDGRSGSGKSTFADELARVLDRHGIESLRSTTDSFHNDRDTRYRLGARSPEGYYRDSFNLERLREELVDPLRRGSGSCCLAVFDEPTNTALAPDYFEVDPSHVLIFDGLFLHRPELRPYWDVSVLLESEERSLATAAEWAVRASGGSGASLFMWLTWWWSIARRYVEGWRIYEAECVPSEAATFTVDNNDFIRPRILHRS